MKKILYGISDFNDMRVSNAYYVDKTKYIERMEQLGSRHLFFFRPRRFGKTLFLSTLEHYYDINRKDDFEKLFGDLYIGKNPTPLRNTFPILRLNFSAVRGEGSIDSIRDSFNRRIRSSINSFILIYKDILDIEYSVNMKSSPIEEAADLLGEFVDYLSTHDIKIYLLIDEYDNFANNLLAQHGKDKYYEITHGTGFLRGFFNIIKAGTDSSTIARLFATGVTPLLLSDVTSGFNIGRNISNEYDFHELAGFTESDVQKIVEYHIEQGLVSETIKTPLLSTMKQYYDGYSFSPNSTETLYNSTAVWHLIQQFHTTYKNQKNNIPNNLIDTNLMTDYKKLEFLVIEEKKLNGNFSLLSDLLTARQYRGELVNIFAVNELIDTNKFVSFLYYLGLLTMRVNENNECVFSVPNQTCSEILWGYVRRAINEVFDIRTPNLFSLFSDMKSKNDWKPVFEYSINQLYANASLRDFIQQEATLKGFLLATLVQAKDYKIYSEHELNKGYADIYMVPNLLRTPKMSPTHYLIELKFIKKADLTETNQEQVIEAVKAQATKQINQYAQDSKLANVSLTKLVIIVSSNGLLLLEQIP